jgi:chromosome segregation ATPase/Tfp pilus assembly protein PilF
MSRRFLLPCLIASAAIIRTLCAADPSEQFLQAYQSYEQGERAEREGNNGDALKNYRYAESLLVAVTQKDPSWQKAVVQYRLKKIRDGLSRLGKSSDTAVSPEAAPAEVPAGDTVPATDAPPEPRVSTRAPSITISVPGASVSSRSQGESGTEVRRLNRLIDSLRNELRTVREASQSEKGRADDLDRMQWTKDKSQMEEQLTRARDEIASLKEKVRQRDSWEHDLKDLQKRLDDAVADKASAEEFFQEKNRKMGDDVASLTKQLEEARAKIARSGEGGKQAEELSKQVERDAESLKQLQARLDQAVQASKESESKRDELQSKIKDLTVQLDQVQKRADELAPLREKLASLRKEADASKEASSEATGKTEEMRRSLQKRDADFAVLQEERDAMAKQIRQLADAAKEASKVGGLEAQSEEFRKTISTLKEQVAAANRQAEDARKRLEAAVQESKDSAQKLRAASDAIAADKSVLEEEKRGLERRLADAQKDQSAGLKEKLEANARELKDSADKIAAMERDRAAEKADADRKSASEQAIKEALQGQNATLQTQLKDALGRIETFVNNSAEGDAVKSQLASLKQQLDENVKNYQDSQKKLSELAASRPGQEEELKQKQKELEASRSEAGKLRGDLEDANRRIADLQTRTAQTEDRLKQLQDQLAEKDARLAALKKKRGSKVASAGAGDEENGVLRGIILRQVKEEAKRAQARRLVQEEMKKLNLQSQVFDDQLAVLSAPVIVLTPEERALFKDDQLVVVEGDAGAMQASVAAPLGKDNAGAAPGESHDTNGPAATPPDASKGGASAKNGEIAWQGKFKECLSRAKDEFDRQDYLQAESSFKEALGYSADDYFALSNLGVVEFQLGKLKEAEDALLKASRGKTDSSFALTTLGIVYYRQQRSEDAEKTLRKAIAINGQDFTAHNYLGIVLAAAGKGSAGESEIMKAIEINPNYADAHFNLAVIYATGKPPSKMMARKHYAKALELGAPPDPSLEHLVQ